MGLIKKTFYFYLFFSFSCTNVDNDNCEYVNSDDIEVKDSYQVNVNGDVFNILEGEKSEDLLELEEGALAFFEQTLRNDIGLVVSASFNIEEVDFVIEAAQDTFHVSVNVGEIQDFFGPYFSEIPMQCGDEMKACLQFSRIKKLGEQFFSEITFCNSTNREENVLEIINRFEQSNLEELIIVIVEMDYKMK